MPKTRTDGYPCGNRRNAILSAHNPLQRQCGCHRSLTAIVPASDHAIGDCTGIHPPIKFAEHSRQGFIRAGETAYPTTGERSLTMTVKIAINGFGRIGRLAYRAMLEQGIVGKGKEVDVVAVGDIVPADNLAYLVKYDTMQGRFRGKLETKKSAPDKPDDDVLIVEGDEMRVVSAKSPAELPWKAMGVDIVIECTGLFTEAEKAKGHLAAGAKKVIISAPA